MRKSAILISGANGEMGHALISALHNSNITNIVAMDLNTLDKSIAHYCSEQIIGNILDEDLIEQLNAEYEFSNIFHLAALLSNKAEFSPQAAHDVNVSGTINLLHLALKQGQSQGKLIKFFFPSSIAVYGLKNLKEKNQAGSITEDKYLNPTTMYGCNKLYCEHLGLYFSKYYQQLDAKPKQNYIDFRSIRFPGIISSKTIPTAGTSDYIPEMLHSVAQGNEYRCFVDKNTQIPFMTMVDAIDAIIKIMNSPKKNLTRNVYNVRSFAPTAKEFKEHLIKFFPNAVIKFNKNEKRQEMINSWPMDTNDEAAKKDWGWKPHYNLDQALQRYLIPEINNKYFKMED
tara:strand:- start:427 stop:1455 length:1029 start_codon:yes stop_codon:yes gene_type:complete